MAANQNGTYRYISVRRLKELLRWFPDDLVVGCNWIGNLELWKIGEDGKLVSVSGIDLLNEHITAPKPEVGEP